MSERARWRKVWIDLWSTPSLLHLDHAALYVLVVLVVHASWDRSSDEGRLTVGADKPMPEETLARLCRLTLAVLTRALRDLADTSTIEIRGGLIVLPRFARWQESSDAHRKRARKVRGKSDGVSEESPRKPAGKAAVVSVVSPSPSTSPSPSVVLAAQRAPASMDPAGLPRMQAPPVNLPPDERDLDDPDVRSLGDVVARHGADAWLFELDVMRRTYRGTLPKAQADLVVPFNRRDTLGGLQAALDEYGPEHVVEVCMWSWREAAAGRITTALLACTFRHDGFGARRDAWRKATDIERQRAASEAEERAKRDADKARDAEAIGHRPDALAAVLSEAGTPEFLRRTAGGETT